MSASLGFANTYALAVRGAQAERLGLRTIGDLARHPDLSAAFSSGFLEREDGWPGLKRHYGLGLTRVSVMEHALTYRALAAGQVDVMDVFSTDGQLERLQLRLLEDDRRFFPDYSAVLLARREVAERFPRTWIRLREALEGRIDGARMARLNAMADLDGKRVPEVAATFLGTSSASPSGRHAMGEELVALTLDHLVLVLVPVGAAMLLGVPMGVLAARFRRAGQLELSVIAMLQTIPALALLMFMIPLFGIGKGPALVALTVYALLPIARSTHAGVIAIDRQLLEIAVRPRPQPAHARAPRGAAAGIDQHHGGHQDGGGDDGGHRDAGGLHRRRGLRKPDRPGPGARRHGDDSRRGRAGRGHGPRVPRALRAARPGDDSPRPAPGTVGGQGRSGMRCSMALSLRQSVITSASRSGNQARIQSGRSKKASGGRP